MNATLLAAAETVPGRPVADHLQVELWGWLALLAAIIAMLLLDLLVFHRDAHTIGVREAAISSSVWIAIGLAFGLVVWWLGDGVAAGEYYAGYLIEKSLSVDNIFVFALIFRYFRVPGAYQHRVLFWGIVGALAFRAIFIAAGAALLNQFDWMIFVFGGFLVITGIRMARHDDEEIHPENNPILKLVRRAIPMTSDYEGAHLTVVKMGKRFATPLLAVLVVVETSDIIFAVDSIPAIFAVTRDAFIVFSSNAFAILGLRALYFLLAGIIDRFVYLKLGLSVVLTFVGVKMIASEWYHLPIWISLGVIGAVLAISIAASLMVERRNGPPTPSPVDIPPTADDHHE